jgi:hypothetical protein
MIFSGLASKLVARVSRFEPQNRELLFGDLGHKITATILGLDLKTKQAWFVGCATKPMEGGWCRTRVEICWLASPEVSHARVSQSGLKTGGSTTAGGACCIIVEVASGSS